jgi:hypothetical protein
MMADMLHDWWAAVKPAAAFEVYGKASAEAEWRVITFRAS